MTEVNVAGKAAVTILLSPVSLMMLNTVWVQSQVDLLLTHIPCKVSRYHYPGITDKIHKKDSESLKSQILV